MTQQPPAAQPDPRAAVARPGDVHVNIGRPLTGIGGVKVRLTPEYLIWERGTIGSKTEQVPLYAVRDVDAAQTMTQRPRKGNLGNVTVIMTDNRRVFLEDLPDYRDTVDAINHFAAQARARHLQATNTQHVNYGGGFAPAPPQPVYQQPPAPAAPAASSADEILSQLERLGKLRDANVVTTEEFEAKKRELLARL